MERITTKPSSLESFLPFSVIVTEVMEEERDKEEKERELVESPLVSIFFPPPPPFSARWV